MPDLLAGTTVLAQDFPPTVSNAQSTSVTTTSTSYTTSGADCAVVFTAPTSGRVLIYTAARMLHSSTTSGALIAPETRTGSVIGSGTAVETVLDAHGTSHYGNTFARSGATHMVSGLTPGASYNCRLLMRSSVTTDTATFAFREVIVQPVP